VSEQAQSTPLVDLLRAVPKHAVARWYSAPKHEGDMGWHVEAPIGEYAHEAADEIDRLTSLACGEGAHE